jgi:hypothetical protein
VLTHRCLAGAQNNSALARLHLPSLHNVGDLIVTDNALLPLLALGPVRQLQTLTVQVRAGVVLLSSRSSHLDACGLAHWPCCSPIRR